MKPLIKIVDMLIPVIVVLAPYIFGVIVLLKEPPQAKPTPSKDQTVKTDTNIYKPKNQK